ncbi:MAG: ATP-binding cassette domain-containing protein, partial [Brachymonas sp.]
MLELREFGCSFGQHVVFQGLNAQIPLQGITILMGPTKTGKSTLMRTLAGQYRGNVHMRQWGDIRLNGVPLEEAGPVPLMRQHVRMLQATVREAFHVLVRQRQAAHHVPHLDAGEWAEALLTRYGMSALSGRMSQAVIDLPDWQRYAFITLAHALTAPSLLLLDEPTFGMKPDSVAALLPLLRNISQHHPLLVSLHNQQEARRLGDRILLIGGGQAVASAPVSEFFTHPVNALADHFIHTGSLDLPSPDAPEEWLTDEGRALRESLHQAAPSGEPASPAVQPVEAASAPLPEDRVPAPEPDVTAPAAEAQEPVPMPAQSVAAEAEAVSASASVPAPEESAVEESVPEPELQADSEAAPAAALPAAAAGESAPAEGAG